MNHDPFLVPRDAKIKLKDYDPGLTAPYKSKDETAEKLQADVAKLAEWQAKLYAQNTFALLIILQGIDAAGKDSTIKHVMSGVNPQGCDVKSFKVPSEEENDHDYLWRYVRAMPERGNIGIFNRSYYEEVLVVRVHPQLQARERIPRAEKPDKLWATRFREINDLERYLVSNGIVVLKFFFHLSKAEQKKRFLARLDSPDKNWKFSEADVKERAWWDDYATAFEEMLSNTSTDHAPWHIIPADHKWFTHVAVADIIIRKLVSLNLDFPKLNADQKKALEKAKKLLEDEK
jgi:PPK2 family polyphosphate:nucleotide phosphotransferase